MTSLGFTINQNDLPEAQSYEPLPEGWYSANIDSAELKQTKAGDGQYIKIGYRITGPSHANRVVFGNLNIQNKNPEAEEIGRRQLGEVMRAIGLGAVSDTDQLIGGNLQIKLKIRKSAEYGDSNDVNRFKPLQGSAPPAPAAPAAQEAPRITQANNANGAPPWARK